MLFLQAKIISILILCLHSFAYADSYLDKVFEATQKHPSFRAYLATKESSRSLMAIENAKRYPRVDGVASRVDGRSTVVATPSAWQTGVSMSYPLFDNGRQDAKDRSTQADAEIEVGTALIPLEQAAVDIANAYLKLWEAKQAMIEINEALEKAQNFYNKLSDLLQGGEMSQLTLAKISRRVIDYKSKRLEAMQRYQSALSTWRSTDLPEPQAWVFPELNLQTNKSAVTARLLKVTGELTKADAELEFAKKDEGISLDLQASFLERKYTDGSTPWTPNRIWQISGSYPMYDAGLRSSRSTRQMLMKSTKESELVTEKYQIEIDEKRLRNDIDSIQMIILETEQHCQLQKKLADQMSERFKLGRGEAQEVIESSLSVTDCKLSLLKNKLDTYLRYNDLIRTNGIVASRFLDSQFNVAK
jgi:outer membrane protein TolC